MGKSTIYFSLDVEASGPIPGPWWMCSFGICRTDDVERGMTRKLKPLHIEGFSQVDDPNAMQVVAKGLDPSPWDPGLSLVENVPLVRQHFEDEGIDPKQAMLDLKAWLLEETGNNRAILVGSPVTFDFMWIYWYWWRLLEEMPVFGFSGLDIRSYFMGMHGVGFLGTGKARYLKHYPNEFRHTHDPLDDAQQQGAIWRDMTKTRNDQIEAAKQAKKSKPPPPKDGI